MEVVLVQFFKYFVFLQPEINFFSFQVCEGFFELIDDVVEIAKGKHLLFHVKLEKLENQKLSELSLVSVYLC